jgi:hypothetical protein
LIVPFSDRWAAREAVGHFHANQSCQGKAGSYWLLQLFMSYWLRFRSTSIYSWL